MKSSGKTFVLRIYRADKASSEAIGMVEDCSSGRKRAFRSFEELVSFLSGKRRSEEPASKRSRKGTKGY